MNDEDGSEAGATAADMAGRLAKAEAAMRAMGEEFMGWLAEDMPRLTAARAQLDDPAREAAALDEIFTLTHDIKGQAGGYGFDLIGDSAGLICDFVRDRKALPEAERAKLARAVAVLEKLVEARVRGDGGADGRRILDRLTAMLDGTA